MSGRLVVTGHTPHGTCVVVTDHRVADFELAGTLVAVMIGAAAAPMP